MLTPILLIKRLTLVVATMAVIGLPAVATAATTSKSTTTNKSTTTDASNQVTQGYGTTKVVQKGMIVKLVDKDPTKVEPVTSTTVGKMQGVVVAANDAAIALANNGNSGQVFVATSGHYDVLVSNQNGPIKAGDYLTISALEGIAMKDDSVASAVLGRATSSFDGSSNVSASATLSDSTGKKVKVSIGRVQVDINVGHNPLQQTGEKLVPSFLRVAAGLVSDKPLNANRIYFSLFVLIATTFVSGGMLYSGIRGGLIAIGRNPLAKKQIVGGIIRVVLMGTIVFLIGMFGVYLLLKL